MRSISALPIGASAVVGIVITVFNVVVFNVVAIDSVVIGIVVVGKFCSFSSLFSSSSSSRIDRERGVVVEGGGDGGDATKEQYSPLEGERMTKGKIVTELWTR